MTGTDRRYLAGPTEAQRDQAMARWQILRPHIEDGVPLARLAGHGGVAGRTLQRWAARYRADGLVGLARRERADRGARRFPDELRLCCIPRRRPVAQHQHGWKVQVSPFQRGPGGRSRRSAPEIY